MSPESLAKARLEVIEGEAVEERTRPEAELRHDHENRADSMAPVTSGLQRNGAFAQPATTRPTLIGCTSFFLLPRFPEVPFAYAASTVHQRQTSANFLLKRNTAVAEVWTVRRSSGGSVSIPQQDYRSGTR
jgi:hypothetical protein